MGRVCWTGELKALPMAVLYVNVVQCPLGFLIWSCICSIVRPNRNHLAQQITAPAFRLLPPVAYVARVVLWPSSGLVLVWTFGEGLFTCRPTVADCIPPPMIAMPLCCCCCREGSHVERPLSTLRLQLEPPQRRLRQLCGPQWLHRHFPCLP